MKKILLLATALFVFALPVCSNANEYEDLDEEGVSEILTQIAKKATNENNQALQKENNLPEMEKKFIDINIKYQNEFKSLSSKNDIKKRLLFKQRVAEFNALNFDGNVTDWKGSIRDIETNGDRIYINIEIAPKIALRYYTSLEDSLINILMELEEGNPVVFSGKLIPDRENKGFNEFSWTTEGSMKSPDFEFNLTNIKIINN